MRCEVQIETNNISLLSQPRKDWENVMSMAEFLDIVNNDFANASRVPPDAHTMYLHDESLLSTCPAMARDVQIPKYGATTSRPAARPQREWKRFLMKHSFATTTQILHGKPHV